MLADLRELPRLQYALKHAAILSTPRLHRIKAAGALRGGSQPSKYSALA